MPSARVNGIDLFYEDSGPGSHSSETTDSAPLLLHHGWTSTHHAWDDLVPRISDRYRCVRLDARGTGDSSRPNDGYTVEQYASDTLGLADALALQRFSFVGHSLGGAVGFQLGVHHADRLDKLVLLAPAPADGGEIPAEDRRARLEPWYAKDRDLIANTRMLSSPRKTDRALAERRADKVLAVSEGHMTQSLDSLEQLRLGESLETIRTPTLMIAAAADGFLPYNLHDFGRLPNASLHVFSRVGHNIESDVPAALARVIPDFLEHGVMTAQTLADRARALQAPDPA